MGVSFAMIILILLLSPFLCLALLFFFVSKWRGQRNLGQQEQSQLEEMYRALEKMEERIANLETILMQRGQPSKDDKGL